MTEQWDRTWEIARMWIDAPSEDLTRWLKEHCEGDKEREASVRKIIESTKGLESNPALVGTHIGPYEIQRQIGSGGMGQVWEAMHRELGNRVALKILATPFATAVDRLRFEQESLTQAKLNHPGIVPIHLSGIWQTETGNEHPWFSMELIVGARSITEYCREENLEPRAVIELFGHICAAVGYANELGVIHRDLKPTNVLVDSDGTPIVIDFGISSSRESNDLTGTGSFIGSVRYSAPERLSDSTHGDTRTDVYSLGVILFELLAQRGLFEIKSQTSATADVKRQQASPIPKLNRAGVPAELDWILARALAADRQARYPNAMLLADEVKRVLSFEPVHARPIGTLHRAKLFCLRNRALVTGTAAVFVTLLAGVWTTSTALARESTARKLADSSRLDAESATRRALDASDEANVERDNALEARRDAEEARDQALRANLETEAARDRALEDSNAYYTGQKFLQDVLRRGLPDTTTVAQFLEDMYQQCLTFDRTEFDPSVRIGSYELTAKLLYDSNRFSAAQEISANALIDAKLALDTNSVQLARIWLLDCELLALNDKLEQADDSAQELLQQLAATLPGSYELAQAHYKWAQANLRTNRLNIAELHFQIARDTAGTSTPKREYLHISSVSNLAVSIHRQGRYAEALHLFKKAYELRQATSRLSPGSYRSLHSYASALLMNRDFNVLQNLLRQHWETQNWPKTNSAVDLDLRETLGRLQSELGYGGMAETTMQEVLAGREAMQGKWHPDVLMTLGVLAEIQSLLGKFDSAVLNAQLEFDRSIYSLGPNAFNTLRSQIVLARLQVAVGRKSEGVTNAESAMKSMLDTLGAQHPQSIRTQADLAYIYADAGEWEKCVQAFHKHFNTGVSGLHPEKIANNYCRLGDALRRTGRYTDSVESYRAALAFFDSQTSLDARYFHVVSGISLCEWEVSPDEEIPKTLLKAWPNLIEKPRSHTDVIVEVADWLIVYLRLEGKDDQAIVVAREAGGLLPENNPAREYFLSMIPESN